MANNELNVERKSFEEWATGPDGPWTPRAIAQRIGDSYGPPELAIQWDCWLARAAVAAPAQAEPSDALPGMPQPAFSTPFLKEMFWVTKGDYYTADQMRAYAKQAIEATRGGALSDAEILLMGANLKPFQAATYRTLQGQQMTQPEQQSYDALMLYTRAMESRIRGQQGGGSDAADAARYRWLRDHACNSLHLTRDGDHACNYVTAKQWIEEFTPEDFVYDAPAEVQAMKDTNTIWRLQIYPNTPIGFNAWHGATLDAAIDAAIQAQAGDAPMGGAA